MKSRPEDESLRHDVIFEQLVAISGFVVGAQEPIADAERRALAYVAADNRKKMPGKVRPDPEPANVPLHREMPSAAEALVDLQPDNGIDPLLRLIESAKKNRPLEVELALENVPAGPEDKVDILVQLPHPGESVSALVEIDVRGRLVHSGTQGHIDCVDADRPAGLPRLEVSHDSELEVREDITGPGIHLYFIPP